MAGEGSKKRGRGRGGGGGRNTRIKYDKGGGGRRDGDSEQKGGSSNPGLEHRDGGGTKASDSERTEDRDVLAGEMEDVGKPAASENPDPVEQSRSTPPAVDAVVPHDHMEVDEQKEKKRKQKQEKKRKQKQEKEKEKEKEKEEEKEQQQQEEADPQGKVSATGEDEEVDEQKEKKRKQKQEKEKEKEEEKEQQQQEEADPQGKVSATGENLEEKRKKKKKKKKDQLEKEKQQQVAPQGNVDSAGEVVAESPLSEGLSPPKGIKLLKQAAHSSEEHNEAVMPKHLVTPSAADLKTEEVKVPATPMTSSSPVKAENDAEQQSRMAGVPLAIHTDKGSATLRKRVEDVEERYTLQDTSSKFRRGHSSEPTSSESSGNSSSTREKKPQKETYSAAEFHQIAAESEIRKREKKRKEEAERKETERKKAEAGTVKGRFTNFLETFVMKGENVFGKTDWPSLGGSQIPPDLHQAREKKPYYTVMVTVVIESGETALLVDFEHVMDHDFQLAVDIVNHSNYQELEAAARSFAMNQVSDDLKGKVRKQMTLRFSNRPTSIVSVKDLLEKPGAGVEWFKNMLELGEDACNLSELMMALFAGFLEYIFETHKLYRYSWRGEFDITHMYVIDKWRYIITKKPTFLLEGDGAVQFFARKGDLCRLPEIFTPFVDCKSEERVEGQPPKDSDLPLFYPELRDALQGVTQELMEEDWFQDYVVYFPALVPGIARHDVVTDSCLVLKRDNVPIPLNNVATKVTPPAYRDWRAIQNSEIELLKKIYTYKEDSGDSSKEGHKGGPRRAGGSKQAAGGLGGTHDRELFPQCIKGEVTYDRHLRVHASDTVTVSSIAETDAFSSKKLVVYLPDFLKRMLSGKLMEKVQDVRDIWRQYKSARIMTTDGSTVKPGPRFPRLM